MVPAPASAFVGADGVRSVAVSVVGLDDLWQLTNVDEDIADREALPLALINGVLDAQDASRLEDAGVGYVDRASQAWLPGFLLTSRVGTTDTTDSRKALGPASLRAAQLIADHPTRPWTEPRLSHEAEVGNSTAHNLMSALEQHGLLERHGGGRSTRRTVTDVQSLRRWVVAHRTRGRTARLSCFVRDSTALPAAVDGVRLVHTGAHGAQLMGMPVLSNVARPMVRAAVGAKDLEGLPSRLGGFRTARGANLLLVADPHRLAALDARPLGNVWVAPPSRIAMDLHYEPRGEAAADVFLDLWKDRVL